MKWIWIDLCFPALQRLKLLLGSALTPSDQAEAHRCRLLWHCLQGQVAWRCGHQDPESDGADAGAAAGFQERNAGPAVSTAEFSFEGC